MLSEFARVIQPHLTAHGIEGAEELARRLQAAGVHRGTLEVQRWMCGDPGHADYGDLIALEGILGLSDEESEAVEDALYRDVRAKREARRKEQ